MYAETRPAAQGNCGITVYCSAAAILAQGQGRLRHAAICFAAFQLMHWPMPFVLLFTCRTKGQGAVLAAVRPCERHPVLGRNIAA